MRGEVRQAELKENTHQLLNGPLKHVRAAALAAALVPLASLVATPASAQTSCPTSGGIVCGVVFNDANHNGIQDAGELGIEGVPVTLTDSTNTSVTMDTGPDGIYMFFTASGTYTVSATTPVGDTTSPPNVCCNDTIDSDGVPDGFGNSVAKGVVDGTETDFGFYANQVVSNPGTGTLGYWKNHPDAWPASMLTITIGGVSYTRDQAIYQMQHINKDRTTQMFAQLVAAELNVAIGNDSSCIGSSISFADAWLTANPLGSNVSGSSAAWAIGEPYHNQLDAYNNGLLCAPHRK
jgi:hypothetical protein